MRNREGSRELLGFASRARRSRVRRNRERRVLIVGRFGVFRELTVIPSDGLVRLGRLHILVS